MDVEKNLPLRFSDMVARGNVRTSPVQTRGVPWLLMLNPHEIERPRDTRPIIPCAVPPTFETQLPSCLLWIGQSCTTSVATVTQTSQRSKVFNRTRVHLEMRSRIRVLSSPANQLSYSLKYPTYQDKMVLTQLTHLVTE